MNCVSLKRLVPVLLFCLLVGRSAVAQVPSHQTGQNRNWLFGLNAGMDFNATPPAAVLTNMLAEVGASSISDNAGQLLMYARLDTIWDRSGNIMPNAYGLLPSVPSAPSALAESNTNSLIVPSLEDTNQYYVFSLRSFNFSAADVNGGRLYYSVVDMNLNGGMGDVVPGKKGIKIDSVLADRLTVVKGNMCNLWVLTMTKNGKAIHAFEITRNGISHTPVVSACPAQFTSPVGSAVNAQPFFNQNKHGCMRASPDNKKLAISLFGIVLHLNFSPFGLFLYGGGIQLCDFNNTTGVCSNSLYMAATSNLLGLDKGVSDLCFSPDGTKVYAGHGLLGTTGSQIGLTQYDISSGTAAGILASATEIDTSYTIGTLCGLRLGADDKIYISSVDISLLGFLPAFTLHRIDNPNLAGTAANLVYNAVNLPVSARCGLGLGNPTVARVPTDSTFNKYEVALCAPDTSRVLSAPVNPEFDYVWDNGDTTTDRTVTGPGTYWVMYGPPCPKTVDTFVVKDVDIRFSLGDDTLLCDQPFTLILNAYKEPGARYLWQDGKTDSVYTATQAGTYSVTVSKMGCTASDEIVVDTVDLSQDLGDDTAVCNRQPFTITLDAYVPFGASALWNTGATTPSIEVSQTGTYSVVVTREHCSGRDEITITDEMCECRAYIPNAFSPNEDGRNDVFHPVIEPECPVAGFRMDIYNRWGEVVFHSDNPRNGWKGSYKGVPAESGMYMYVLRFETGTKNQVYEQKGELMLVR